MRELRIPQVGELVMYTDKELTEYEPLFRDPNNLSEDADPYVKWIESDGPGIVLGIVLRVVNPYPHDPNYERCEVFWNGKPPHWMRGSVCSSHILKVVG